MTQPAGRLYAWGANHAGQVTGVPGEDRLRPVAVPGLPPVVQVVCNACTALALDAEGRVWSWGWNHDGLLGRGPRPGQARAIWTPAALRRRGRRVIGPSTEPPTAVSADDTPWADSPEWQEAVQMLQSAVDGAQADAPAPALQGACPPAVVTGLPPIAQIAIGQTAALALDQGGHVWAWGDGIVCSQPPDKRTGMPATCWTPVPGLEGIRHISLHPDGTAAYAVDASGAAWSWGYGWEGELGQGKRRSDAVPAPIVLQAPVRCLTAGACCALALLEDGTVWGWGNADVQVGFQPPRSNTLRVLLPVAVPGLVGAVRRLWLGASVAVYRLDNGDSYACGAGRELWHGTWCGDSPADPMRAPALDGWDDMALGDARGLAVDYAGARLGLRSRGMRRAGQWRGGRGCGAGAVPSERRARPRDGCGRVGAYFVRHRHARSVIAAATGA